MQSLVEQLAERVAQALVHSPDADADAIGALYIGASPLGAELDERFAALSESARQLMRAHGRWGAWDHRATDLCEAPSERAAVVLAELVESSWLTPARAFSPAVRAWMRARLEPSAEMRSRAAAAAEDAYHRFRCAGAGDIEARAALLHWSAWSAEPEIGQWAAVALEALPVEGACDTCRAWAAIEASRAAQWRGFEHQAMRLLDQADEAALTERARFFVAFLRAIRATQRGDEDASRQVEALAGAVPAEEERLFLHQAQAVLATAQARDPRPALRLGLGLAMHLSMPFREAHIRVLLALAEWPDGDRMRDELELLDLSRVQLTPRDRWNVEWAWARTHLAREDVARAALHARNIVEDRALAELNAGGSWGIIALAEHHSGSTEASAAAMLAARRAFVGEAGEALSEWFDRVLGGGEYFPLPDIAWSRPRESGWVAADGSAFQVLGSPVDLRRSPVSVALLAALIDGPKDAAALIDACWPNDAASYLSLRNRLHSAVRTLRRRGLEPHVVYEGEKYQLVGLRVVDATAPSR